MLEFPEFFKVCTGLWKTERIYHYTDRGEIERSHTEFRVEPLSAIEKQKILSLSSPDRLSTSLLKVESTDLSLEVEKIPGFAIAFDTRSETGETVSMSLKALFVPDRYMQPETAEKLQLHSPALPAAAQVAQAAEEEVIQGYYFRDEGYSESGAIAGRFTYQTTRQTLEMMTYYRRSVALDQMRIVAPNLRLRTIITYKRPANLEEPPSAINLIGFGVEHRQPL